MRIMKSLVASLIFLATTEPTELHIKGNVYCDVSTNLIVDIRVLELDTIQHDLIYYKENDNLKNDSFSFWIRRSQTTDGHFDNHFELGTYLKVWCEWYWSINVTSPIIPTSTEVYLEEIKLDVFWNYYNMNVTHTCDENPC